MNLSRVILSLNEQLAEDFEDVVVRIDDAFFRVSSVEKTDHGVTIVCEEEVR
jgi:hypothetical protein